MHATAAGVDQPYWKTVKVNQGCLIHTHTHTHVQRFRFYLV